MTLISRFVFAALVVILAPLSAFSMQDVAERTAPLQMEAQADSFFTTVELWIDAGDQTLAAYQLEFRATVGEARIVGIEGGAHDAFSEPPYYDPAAMRQERVIIADFSTAPADRLPRGRTRIATIHVQITGDVEPVFETNLTVAAAPGGEEIDAQLTFKLGTEP